VARSWTKNEFKAGDQFKADQWNDETNGYAQQFNGQLDQHSMPMLGAKAEQFIAPVRTSNAHGANTTSSYLATQSYHYATYYLDNTASLVTSEITPTSIFITDFESQSWENKWNTIPVSGTPSIPQGTKIRFNAKEGMIYGGLTISGERRAGRITYIAEIDGEDESFVINVGEENMYEFGVFVNGVLCGRTGDIQIGAWTYDLPYSTPIGTEFVEVEVKWQATQNSFPATQIPTTVNNADYRKFAISGMQLWARNQYR
tara:strand:+ start:504 stop:1277 length:774 start_codon:yes stop_codon:yes gene_type:complete